MGSESPSSSAPSRRQLARLRDELVENQVSCPLHGPVGDRLLEELAYARGPHIHESRVPTYGCVILVDPDGVGDDVAAEVIEASDMETPVLRRFADGTRVFLVAAGARTIGLACLDQNADEERTVIRFVRRSGAIVIRRADDGHVSVVTEAGVAVWDGTRWLQKPHADRATDLLHGTLADTNPDVLEGLMELCLHWLMPARVGAVVVWHPAKHADELDGLEGIRTLTPVLTVTNELHRPALRSAVSQADGAVLVGPAGDVLAYGATLLPTQQAIAEIPPSGGTRQTSAHRFSFDHPEAVIVSVSDDGPLTLYNDGKRLDLVLY
ncbi:MAG: diadenylate cyclase [Nitriliruptorales bacterium]|nr:diadenylate cyclase [Nitriliruptorales bacterium]